MHWLLLLCALFGVVQGTQVEYPELMAGYASKPYTCTSLLVGFASQFLNPQCVKGNMMMGSTAFNSPFFQFPGTQNSWAILEDGGFAYFNATQNGTGRIFPNIIPKGVTPLSWTYSNGETVLLGLNGTTPTVYEVENLDPYGQTPSLTWLFAIPQWRGKLGRANITSLVLSLNQGRMWIFAGNKGAVYTGNFASWKLKAMFNLKYQLLTGTSSFTTIRGIYMAPNGTLGLGDFNITDLRQVSSSKKGTPPGMTIHNFMSYSRWIDTGVEVVATAEGMGMSGSNQFWIGEGSVVYQNSNFNFGPFQYLEWVTGWKRVAN